MEYQLLTVATRLHDCSLRFRRALAYKDLVSPYLRQLARTQPLLRCPCAAVPPPDVCVTFGNVLLVRVVSPAYLTGDPGANDCLLLDRVEVFQDCVNGAPIPVDCIPVSPQADLVTPLTRHFNVYASTARRAVSLRCV